MKTYAHSKLGEPKEKWQLLSDHNNAVGEFCSSFASSFSSKEFGRILGEMHDFGKARSSFQGYLARANGLDDEGYDNGAHDHSTARGMMATQKLIVFKHDSEFGNAPSHMLFDLVKIAKKDEVSVPRKFADYNLSVPGETELPADVKVEMKL